MHRTYAVEYSDSQIFGRSIRTEISSRFGVPTRLIILICDAKPIQDVDVLNSESSFIIRASIKAGLLGGKGGFGAMLRSLAKQSGGKKTTDFGACRDLSGRRLRHVNDEKILQRWKEARDNGEDFDVEQETQSGIDLWFMSTPSWSEGFSGKYLFRKRFMKPRLKTQLCLDWMRAREESNPPRGAPIHWGCPRGARCEYAHGEQELRGEALEKLKNEKKQLEQQESEVKKNAYLQVIDEERIREEEQTNNMMEAIRMGLQKRKGKTMKVKSINKQMNSSSNSGNNNDNSDGLITMENRNDSMDIGDDNMIVQSHTTTTKDDTILGTSVENVNAGNTKVSPDETDDQNNQHTEEMLTATVTCSWLSAASGSVSVLEDGRVTCMEGFGTVMMKASNVRHQISSHRMTSTYTCGCTFIL